MAEIIGVVGAGTMGRGIAQLFAQSGHQIRLHDAEPASLGAALTFIHGLFDRQLEKGSIDEATREVLGRRIVTCAALDDLAGCGVVIEAIAESLEAKQDLFARLEPVVGSSCLLASNTSSLSISGIAAACAHPDRVAGVHFFNPVPLMKIAEVVPGLLTAPETVDRLVALVTEAGHRAVTAADQPGFLVNHAGRALYTEGLRVVEEGVTDYHGVDRIVREALGFRLGPFELLDLTGLDISAKVMESIYAQFQHDGRYRPSALVAPRVAAGLFGRKSGRGFYRYADGRKVEPGEAVAPAIGDATVWIGEGARSTELAALCASAGVTLVSAPDDASRPLLLISPWGEDLSSTAARLGLDARRLAGVDPLPDFSRRRTLMVSPLTDPGFLSAAHALLASDGTPVTVIADSAGFVSQRIVAMIVNTGCEIAQRRIAAPRDLDAAVKLGLGYPEGPLALGDRIGPARIVEILGHLMAINGDQRYRPSLWLRRRAQLGMSLLAAGPEIGA